jgi:hypothetical protein
VTETERDLEYRTRERDRATKALEDFVNLFRGIPPDKMPVKIPGELKYRICAVLSWACEIRTEDIPKDW